MKISELLSRVESKEQSLNDTIPEERALKSLFFINRLEVQGYIDNGQLSQEAEVSSELASELEKMLVAKKVTADQINGFFQKLKAMKTSDEMQILIASQRRTANDSMLMSNNNNVNNVQNTLQFTSSVPEKNLNFEQKLEKVKAHLTRWAAAEEYATAKEKIGYAGHLKWLNTNIDLYKSNDKDTKAKAILDAYVSMPGFGAQADKHHFVDLHMDLDLLDLEIKGLEKTGKDANAKKKEREQKEQMLLFVLDKERQEINDRLKEAIAKDPEIKQYIEPIVNEYMTWLRKIKKSKTMPKFTVLDGPPGTGKTFFGQTVADILGMDLHVVGMSSEDDVTIVPGRNKGWENPQSGKCAELQRDSDSQLFLWFPDEFEKAEKAVINTYVELLEAGTSTYADKFFNNNRVPKYFTSFIATTNDYGILPSHIKSRAKKILMKGKRPEEKLNLIKKMLHENISDNTVFRGKKITYSPDEDQLLLWFLKSYSTQPGLREDKSNVETIVSKMAEYFDKNNAKTSFELNEEFIKASLPPVSKRHADKQRLYALRIDLVNTLGAEVVDGRNGNYSNDSLPKIITNRNLMRIYTKELINILEQDLLDYPDNAGLLNEELQELRDDLKAYQELTVQQVEFLCENIDNIASYGLDVKSLMELTGERLTELERMIEKSNREKLQLKNKKPPEQTVSQDANLKLYSEEKISLEKLRNLLNNAPALYNEADVNEKEKDKKTNSQDRQIPNKNTGSMGGHHSKNLTFGFNAIQRLKKEAQKEPKPRLSAGKLSPDEFNEICDKEIKKIEKMKGFGSKDEVRQYTDKKTQEKIEQNKYTAEERFDHKMNTIAMYQNLNAVKLQDTLIIKETNNGVEETLVNITRDKLSGLVKITSERADPGDKALLEMALFAQRCSKTGVFNIDNCEQNPEAAIKLFLFGRALDLKPHLNTETQKAIDDYVNTQNGTGLAGVYQNCRNNPNVDGAAVLAQLDSWESTQAGTRLRK
jgi:hypothetical protein